MSCIQKETIKKRVWSTIIVDFFFLSKIYKILTLKISLYLIYGLASTSFYLSLEYYWVQHSSTLIHSESCFYLSLNFFYLYNWRTMSTCQVDSCSCRESLPIRGNIGTCIWCNHPVSVHLSSKDDEIEIIPTWNCKSHYLYILIKYSNKYFLIYSYSNVKQLYSHIEFNIPTWLLSISSKYSNLRRSQISTSAYSVLQWPLQIVLQSQI